MPKHSIQQPLEYRILVFGDSGVGKTSFITRYIRNEYPCTHMNSSSSDGTTIYQTVIDGNDCCLIFIDISTIYDFQKIKFSDTIPTGCLIFFSITDQRSFTKLNFYHETIRSKFAKQPILIIGNKIDLEPERAVSQQMIDTLKSHGYDVFDISVKGNVGIGDVIYTVIKYLQYEQYNLLEKVKPNNVCACVIA